MRFFFVLAFLFLFSLPHFVLAFEPTGTLDTSPEARTRSVNRSINLESLRERLKIRFSRTQSSDNVAPLVQKTTVVQGALKTTGSVNTVGYVGLALKNLPITVSVPEGFSVLRDTLTENNGELQLKSGTNSILIKASGIKCPASGANLRNCVESNTKAFADGLISQDRGLQYLKQRQDNQLLLGTSSKKNYLGSSRDQVIESLELQSSTKKLNILGFSSPEEEYLWYLVLEGNTQRATSIGHDSQALYRVFNSLSQPASSATLPARNQLNQSYIARDRFRSNYRFRSNTSAAQAESIFESKYIPELNLHLEVMNGSRQVEDGAEGVYTFQNGASEVSISLLEQECSGNTSNLLQRCLKEQLDDIDDVPEGFRIVMEKNILMELDKTIGYKNHLGRYVLWQRQGNAREGVLLFRHPWMPTVFRVDFASDSAGNNWAYNDVILNRFLSSFYFDERE